MFCWGSSSRASPQLELEGEMRSSSSIGIKEARDGSRVDVGWSQFVGGASLGASPKLNLEEETMSLSSI